jgi:hypothetical protein
MSAPDIPEYILALFFLSLLNPPLQNSPNILSFERYWMLM